MQSRSYIVNLILEQSIKIGESRTNYTQIRATHQQLIQVALIPKALEPNMHLSIIALENLKHMPIPMCVSVVISDRRDNYICPFSRNLHAVFRREIPHGWASSVEDI